MIKLSAVHGNDVAVEGVHFDGFVADETAVAADDFDAVAAQLIFKNVHFPLQRHVEPPHQILGGDVLLDPVGAAVETAFTPAGEVEHGLAHGLAGDGAGMHAHSADLGHAVDDGDLAPQFCRLNGGGFARRAAADDDDIVFLHDLLRAGALLESLLESAFGLAFGLKFWR